MGYTLSDAVLTGEHRAEFAPFIKQNGIVEEEQPVETHITTQANESLRIRGDMNLISDEIYRQLVKDSGLNASLKQLFSHFDTVSDYAVLQGTNTASTTYL